LTGKRSSESFQTTSVSDSYFKKSKRDYDQTKEKLMKKLLFIFLGLASFNVYANGCPGQFDPVSGICRFQGHNGEMVQYNMAPPQSSNVQNNTKVININVPSKYGAWAFNSKTGIAGGALDMDSRAAAEKEAIKTCEQGGRNAPCVVGIWVRNGCIAVAQGKSGGKVKTFYGSEPSPGRAEPSALRKCQAAGVAQCKIVASEGCSIPQY